MEEKLLIRYIIGKANRSETRKVCEWIRESNENAERFAKMKAEYVFSSFPNKIMPQKRNPMPYFYSACAMLFIPLIMLCVYLFIENSNVSRKYADTMQQMEVLLNQNAGSVTYTANPGTKSTVLLGDSTTVMLNCGSKLTVPKIFSTDCRDLQLEGEGFFEVSHNDNWPMQIKTPKGVTVKVLGTTFDLCAYKDDSDVTVTLIDGKVAVQRSGKVGHVTMLPFQRVTIADGTEATPVPTSVDKSEIARTTAWTKGELVFDNTPMPQILKMLERWYGVTIHVSDRSILEYNLTATFSSESITRVMELLKFSSMIDYRIEGSHIYIRSSSHRS